MAMELAALSSLVDDFPFRDECGGAVDALRRWKNALLDHAVDNPLEAMLMVWTGGAMVFYLAEREVNEEVRTYGDALHYIATCFNVGYANIYPVTQVGRTVAAIVMVFGPSLVAWQLEGRLVRRQAEASAAAPADPAMLARLDAILAALQAQGSAQASSSVPGGVPKS